MSTYEEKVLSTYEALSKENAAKEGREVGASPQEVVLRMRKDGTLSGMDTVIDIKDVMTRLRSQGRL